MEAAQERGQPRIFDDVDELLVVGIAQNKAHCPLRTFDRLELINPDKTGKVIKGLLELKVALVD